MPRKTYKPQRLDVDGYVFEMDPDGSVYLMTNLREKFWVDKDEARHYFTTGTRRRVPPHVEANIRKAANG